MAGKKRAGKSKSPKVTFQLLVSLLLIAVGASLLSYATMKNFGVSLFEKQKSKDETVNIKPQYSAVKSVNIAKININLPVEDGKVIGDRWQVSQSGVSFYTASSLPEEGGNTVLYGHNKAKILGGLVVLNKGDKIELTLENGKILKYEVSETKTVKPTEIEILNSASEPQLTIYTCTGFLDQARFVVLAKPTN